MLEVVDIQNRERQLLVRSRLCNFCRHNILEPGAVWQFGQAVKTRHVQNALFRLNTGRHVFEYENHALFAAMTRTEFKPGVLVQTHQRAVFLSTYKAIEMLVDLGEIFSCNHTIAGAEPQRGFQYPPAEVDVWIDIEKFAGFAVCNLDPSVAIKHEQSMRHVVECCVEPLSNLGSFSFGGHCVEQEIPDAICHGARGQKQRQQQNRHQPHIGVPGHHETGQYGKACSQDDHVYIQPRTEIPSDNGNHRRQCHRDCHQFRKRVLRHHQRMTADRTQHESGDQRSRNIPFFPMQRFRKPELGFVLLVEEHHVEIAAIPDYEKRESCVKIERIVDAQIHRHCGDHMRDHARKQRAPLLIKRGHEGKTDVIRECCVVCRLHEHLSLNSRRQPNKRKLRTDLSQTGFSPESFTTPVSIF